MSSRRAKSCLQACLSLSVVSIIVYAFYVNRTLSQRVAASERKSSQHAKHVEQLGSQMQGVLHVSNVVTLLHILYATSGLCEKDVTPSILDLRVFRYIDT